MRVVSMRAVGEGVYKMIGVWFGGAGLLGRV